VVEELLAVSEALGGDVLVRGIDKSLQGGRAFDADEVGLTRASPQAG
jgi:hypothetical protein